LHFSLTKVEQSTFNIKISESNQYSQSDQQFKEVFFYDFNDPIANFLESMNNIYVKVFLSDESWLCHLFKSFFYWLCIPLFFGSRPRTDSLKQFLAWLHWKDNFTWSVCVYWLEVGVGKRISSSYEQVDHFQLSLLNKQGRLQAGYSFAKISCIGQMTPCLMLKATRTTRFLETS